MSEAVVVYLFLAFRVLFVGGILLALPRVTRKGLLFGVYVGEEFANGREARTLRRRWDLGCLQVMALALLVGLAIAVAGYPVAGNLTGTGVLLLAALVLYIRSYSQAHAMAPAGAARQAQRATASLQGEKPAAATFAQLAFVVCLLVALGTFFYALHSYGSMADRVPSLRQALGSREGLTDKSLLAVLYAPALNLVLSPFFALLAWLTATAKRSIRDGPGRGSAEAQETFRSTMAEVFAGMALLLCALLAYFSVQLVRVWLLEIPTMGSGLWWLMGAFILCGFVSVVGILWKYGQGGAVLERSTAEGSLTGGLADNARWLLGMFYFDPDDPALMVEKRFGFGYSINYGNRLALAITITYTIMILSLVALGFFL